MEKSLTSVGRLRSPVLKSGICPLPTRAELKYANDIIQSFPKEAKAILSKLSSSPKLDSKGRKLMIGGAHPIHHLLTMVICLGLAGVSISTITYYLGPIADSMKSTISSTTEFAAPVLEGVKHTITPCNTWYEYFGFTALSFFDKSLSCGQRIERLETVTNKVIEIAPSIQESLIRTGSFSLMGIKYGLEITSKIYNTVLSIVETLYPYPPPTSCRDISSPVRSRRISHRDISSPVRSRRRSRRSSREFRVGIPRLLFSRRSPKHKRSKTRDKTSAKKRADAILAGTDFPILSSVSPTSSSHSSTKISRSSNSVESDWEFRI